LIGSRASTAIPQNKAASNDAALFFFNSLNSTAVCVHGLAGAGVGVAWRGARSVWLAMVHSASTAGLFAYLLRTMVSRARAAARGLISIERGLTSAKHTLALT